MKSLKSTIVNTFMPELHKLGFVYDDGTELPNMWKFIRDKMHDKQIIEIQKSNHSPNALRVQFRTTLSDSLVYGSHLVESDTHWRRYESSSDLLLVLQDFLNIAIIYGIPYLDQAIIPDLYATTELEKKLVSTYSSQYVDFQRAYNMNFDDSNVLTKIESVVMNRKLEVIGDDWDFMLKASAFLGEYVRYEYKGHWSFDEVIEGAAIINISGKPKLKMHPLRWVSSFWGKPDLKFNKLSYMFEGLYELLG